jgi:hypothetical protein
MSELGAEFHKIAAIAKLITAISVRMAPNLGLFNISLAMEGLGGAISASPVSASAFRVRSSVAIVFMPFEGYLAGQGLN